MSFYTDVKDFHQTYELEIGYAPFRSGDEIPHDLWNLRMELVREEYKEFVEAMENGTLVDIADAICDLHYVLSGTSVSFGIDEDACFAEVHRSNMSKKDADGTIHRREDGKIIKGDMFTPPDLESIIYPQPA